MPDVFRAYIPTVKWGFNAFQQLSLATLTSLSDPRGTYPKIVPVLVDPALVHRKVWAWLYSSAGTFALDADIVAMLGGVEVYRQKFVVSTGIQATSWNSGFGSVNTEVGAVNEQVIFTIGTSLYGASPWRLNITADTFYLAVNVLSNLSGTPLYDAGLHIQSQKGI